MSAAVGIPAAGTPAGATKPKRRRVKRSRVALHAFLIVVCTIWVFPLLWAVYISLRSLGDTAVNGDFSLPSSLSFQNYIDAWTQANLPYYYLNTLIVAIPAVVIVLFVSSMLAFALTRVTNRFNLILLLIFTAGNLLPPQVIIVPLYTLYNAIPIAPPLSDNGRLYDQYIGIILIHVVFQTGFCVFVLANYMRTLPRELTEAAIVDGAGIATIYRKVILPLCRPALAALATLEFTFIYNDFFWALLLIETGSKRPITSALNNLQGQFFTNNNLLAAASLLVAIPTVVVYLIFRRQFVRGLTLGATKG
ncbi:MAG: carbohydrate ABC transporter permease [Candidatus Limnocylindrales bacterium]